MHVILHAFGWERLSSFPALASALSSYPPDAIRNLIILGKTEGTATLNDFSREVATASATHAVRASLGQAVADRSTLLFSTGCEGIASPFGLALVVLDGAAPHGYPARLAIGTARTSPAPVEERGASPHAHRVAAAVEDAIASAGLLPDQVRLVLVKSPVLPANYPALDGRAGSTGAARAAGAFGAALALGEVSATELDATISLLRTPLHSRRTMAFSGTELEHDEIVVLGNRQGATGTLVIDTAPLVDALDVGAMRRLAAAHGALWDEEGTPCMPSPLRALFLKLGSPPGGHLRGLRTTVLGSDLTPDKHLRAAASGVAGAVFGTGRVFISGGAEGQAPPGGGLFSMIAEALP